jgi:hypothetical protein
MTRAVTLDTAKVYMSRIKAADVNEPSTERALAQEQIDAGFLGYVRHDLLSNQVSLLFGMVNDRAVNAGEVGELCSAMATEGVRRADMKTLIPVLVDVAYIKPQYLTKVFQPDVMGYSELAAAYKLREVHVLGGQHRFAAIKAYYNEALETLKDGEVPKSLVNILEQISELETALNAGNSGDNDTKKAAAARLQELRQTKQIEADRISRLKSVKENRGWWTFALYDRGMRV